MGFHTPWYYDSFWDFPFRSLSSELHRLRSVDSSGSRSTEQPSYKYRTSSKGITLQVELPGVPREHVSVQVEGRTLVIRREPGSCTIIEKEREDGEAGRTDPVVERKYYLALRLSDRADYDNVTADCCGDGLLVVSIPYREKHVKKVEVGA